MTSRRDDLAPGASAFLRVPNARAVCAFGLEAQQGTLLQLLEAVVVHGDPCWVTAPPVTVTVRDAAAAGGAFWPGQRIVLRAVPEDWLKQRAPAWRADDVAFLKQNAASMPMQQLMKHLGRGSDSVRAKLQELFPGMQRRTEWTPELDEFLSLLYPDHTAEAIAEVMGVGRSALYARAATLGLEKAPGFAAEISRKNTLARSVFTAEIGEMLQLLYPDHRAEDLGAAFGLQTRQIHAWAKRNGVEKDSEWMRELGRRHAAREDHPMHRYRFPKGNVPANKGIKGYDAGERSHLTRFKPGRLPSEARNYVPIGSYRVNAAGLLEQKVTDDQKLAPARRWVSVARLVWERANGAVPPGHVVRFRDGRQRTDPVEVTLEVIECITLAENMRRNSYHTRYPKDVRRLIQLRGVLKRMTNKRQRELAEESSP